MRPAGKPDDADDALHVLVGQRRLLGETLVRRAADDDPSGLELAPDLATADLPARPCPREPPAGAVAGGAERQLHRVRLTCEHVARGAHAPRDEHRLPDAPVEGGYLGGSCRESTRRTLAMDADVPAAVTLDLDDVVRHVVELQRGVCHRRPQDPPCCFAHLMRHRMAIGEREVGGGGHRSQIGPPFRGRLGRARELPVGERDAVPRERGVHGPYVVGAHLVAEPARAGMDENRDLPLAEAEDTGRFGVEDPLHPLDLDEVVPGADRAHLAGAAKAGSLRDRARISAGDAAGRLGALEVVLGADPELGDEEPGAFGEQPVEMRAFEVELSALSRPRRDLPRDIVHERLPPAPELLPGEGQREQPDATVDVVADPPGRDDAVRNRSGCDASDREPVALVDVGHRAGCLDDSRQHGDVLELLERAIAEDPVQQLLVGKEPGRHQHAGTGPGGDLPAHFAETTEAATRRVEAEHPGRAGSIGPRHAHIIDRASPVRIRKRPDHPGRRSSTAGSCLPAQVSAPRGTMARPCTGSSTIRPSSSCSSGRARKKACSRRRW